MSRYATSIGDGPYNYPVLSTVSFLDMRYVLGWVSGGGITIYGKGSETNSLAKRFKLPI
jgi:hypothetical protein